MSESENSLNQSPYDPAFEADFSKLRPRAAQIDRAALLFEAGRQAGLRSAVRNRWIWSVSSAATSAIAASLLGMLFVQATQQIVSRDVVPPEEQAVIEAADKHARPSSDAVWPIPREWNSTRDSRPFGRGRFAAAPSRATRIEKLMQQLAAESRVIHPLQSASDRPRDSIASVVEPIRQTQSLPNYQLRTVMLEELR